jgi:hypothetical protein
MAIALPEQSPLDISIEERAFPANDFDHLGRIGR